MPVYLNKKTKKYDCKGSYVDINGKQRFYTKRGFETSALAKKYDAAFLIKAKKTSMSRITCDDLVVEFLVYKEERGLKLRSISDYHNNYKKHFLPYFANHMIDKITIPDIEKWQENLLKKDYSDEYLKTIQSEVSALFRFAMMKQYILTDPFDYIEYVRNPQKKTKEMLFWTPSEYKMFRSVIDDDFYLLVFDLLYFTGMRLGELQARKWNDLNEADGTLNINSTFDQRNKIISKSTKNGSTRIIYLPLNVLDELKSYKSQNKRFKSDNYILGIDVPIDAKKIRRRKDFYIEKYNEQKKDDEPYLKNIRIHDFRHSHVSLLINNGIDSLTIAERLGHSKEMVENRYSHLFPEKKKAILQVLDLL